MTCKKIVLFFCLVVLINSCRKEDGEADIQKINSGEFNFGNSTHKIEFGSFGKIDSTYFGLYFFSEDLYLNADPFGFIGNGDLLFFILDKSIFNSNVYSIENFTSGEDVEIAGGRVYLGINRPDSTLFDITSGTISKKIKDGYYQFDYNLKLDGSEELTGNYLGGLIVVDQWNE